MKTKTMLNLKLEMDGSGLLVEYKEYLVTVDWIPGCCGEVNGLKVYHMVSDSDSVDMDAWEYLDVSEELLIDSNLSFATAGEALMLAFQRIERKS